MSGISENYLHEVLCKVALASELKEWNYIKETFDTIAQNYFGILIPVILKGKQNGKELSFHLVLKLAPTDERYRVSGAVTLMFAREVFVYAELLNRYEELQKKMPPRCHLDMPKCYLVSNQYCNEFIAMQNMCVYGYKPFTQSVFLDLNHVIIALKSLARLHALSFILKEKDGHTYDNAKDICVPLTYKTNKRIFDIFTDRLEKALVKFENTSYVPLLELLKTDCVYFIESAIYKVKKVCLCHGDIWKENILFKYKDNVPISACLIDYQTMRMSSPAFDVLYLLVSSVDTNLRLNNFQTLLDTYYETLTESLTNANLDANGIYSRENFEYDLSIVSPTCLIVANTSMWLFSGLQEEGHVKSKHVPATEAEKLRAIDQYKTIVKGIIDDLTSYGYLKVTESRLIKNP